VNPEESLFTRCTPPRGLRALRDGVQGPVLPVVLKGCFGGHSVRIFGRDEIVMGEWRR